MSCSTMDAMDAHYEVVCGWYTPAGTSFGQVWETTVPPGTEDDEACLLGVGLTKRVATVAALQEALAAYGTLPKALVAPLEADREEAGPRLVQRRRQGPRRAALAPAGPPPLGAERSGAATPPGDGACGAATHSARAVTTARSARYVVTAPDQLRKYRKNKRIYT